MPDHETTRSHVIEQAGFVFTIAEDGTEIYRLKDFKRESVAAWATMAMKRDQLALAEGRHLRVVIDVRDQMITPYLMVRAQQATLATPHGLVQSVAILTNDSLIMTLAQGVIRSLSRDLQQTVRIFHKEDVAFAWLKERQALLG